MGCVLKLIMYLSLGVSLDCKVPKPCQGGQLYNAAIIFCWVKFRLSQPTMKNLPETFKILNPLKILQLLHVNA